MDCTANAGRSKKLQPRRFQPMLGVRRSPGGGASPDADQRPLGVADMPEAKNTACSTGPVERQICRFGHARRSLREPQVVVARKQSRYPACRMSKSERELHRISASETLGECQSKASTMDCLNWDACQRSAARNEPWTR
eukprot:scaffold120550_cov28-Tisochrysis_lutea.AAC.4